MLIHVQRMIERRLTKRNGRTVAFVNPSSYRSRQAFLNLQSLHVPISLVTKKLLKETLKSNPNSLTKLQITIHKNQIILQKKKT